MALVTETLLQLQRLLGPYELFSIACSGGIDSLLLSIMSHRLFPEKCHIAHLISPAVPPSATIRVKHYAQRENWQLDILESGEFLDPNYLENPVNRCFYCKTNSYQAISAFYKNMHNGNGSFRILSGANMDDLGDYRPGLMAAKNFRVLNPYVELKIGKEIIRKLARELKLEFSELPASPCLASRVYTGTHITEERMKAIDQGEEFIRQKLGLEIIRCRIQGNQMRIEVSAHDQKFIDEIFLDKISGFLKPLYPFLEEISLDPKPYQSGRAFIHP